MSGKGTRFILANTEQLHGKIQEMSDRIRHLEDSIRVMNPESPLLASELTIIKSTMGLYSNSGTPGNAQDKDAKFNESSSDHKCRNNTVAAGDTAMAINNSSCVIQSVCHTTPIALAILLTFIQCRETQSHST